MDEPAAAETRESASGRGLRVGSLVASAAWVGAVGADVAGVWLTTRAISTPGGFEQGVLAPVASLIVAVSFATVGLLLRRRRPDHAMGWLFLAVGLTAGVSNSIWGLMVAGLEAGGDRGLGAVASWLGAVLAPGLWAWLVVTIIVLFPEGRPGSPAERRLLGWAAIGALAVGIGNAMAPGPLFAYPGFPNPIIVPPPLDVVARLIAFFGISVLGGATAFAFIAMWRRYVSASDVVRHQIRWFAYGAAVLGPTSWVYVLVGLIGASDRPALRDATYVLFVLSTTILPIAVLFAITRHRLYEIDRVISRTLVFGALTAILAGVYAASVRLFNALFVVLTGETSEAALVLTTLVLAATFTPIKNRLEHIAGRVIAAEDHAAPADTTDLDARIEAVARRVALEVLEERAPKRSRR